MARRIPVRELLRLRASGLSATAIARTQPVSKTSVMDAFHAADEKGVAWEDVEGMTDAQAYALLFPERVCLVKSHLRKRARPSFGFQHASFSVSGADTPLAS